MIRTSLVVSLAVYLSLQIAAGQPLEDKSLVDDINFEYKNGEWTCGDVKCPPDTFGCEIVKKTFEGDKKLLYQAYNCMDKNKKFTAGAGKKIALANERRIHILVDTFNSVESVYKTLYREGGNEQAEAVVAVDQLDKFKKDFRNITDSLSS